MIKIKRCVQHYKKALIHANSGLLLQNISLNFLKTIMYIYTMIFIEELTFVWKNNRNYVQLNKN